MTKQLRSTSSASKGKQPSTPPSTGNRAAHPSGSQPLTVSARDDPIDNSASALIKEFLPGIKSKVDGLEETLVESVKEEVLKLLKSELDEIRNEIKGMKETILEQGEEIKELKREIQSLKIKNNDRERHSRSWNLVWLTKEEEREEEQAEDTMDLVDQFLNQVPALKNRNIQLDVAHRVGRRYENRPRPILFRLVSKADVWFILRHKKRLRELNQGLVFEDLTKEDREKKKKYSQLMSVLWRQGHRTRFERGQWVVDGRPFREEDYPEVVDQQ